MSARTEQLMQHGSVEAVVETALMRVGANQLKPVGSYFDGPEDLDGGGLDFGESAE
jgi:hypothetical protein